MKGYTSSRSRHIISSSSTDAQQATEAEIAPFYIDLTSLSEGQLDHLRSVGLLPAERLGVDAADVEAVADTVDNDREPSGKAAMLLGVNEMPSAATISHQQDGTPPGTPSNLNDEADFDPYAIQLLRQAHTAYLTNALSNPLSKGFVSLDASHPWMVYWCLHSLDLLGYFHVENENDSRNANARSGLLKDIDVLQKAHLLKRVVSTLDTCWTDTAVELSKVEVERDGRLSQLISQQEMNDGQVTATTTTTITIAAGGFAGGNKQMPHCAPTYAAVLALSIVAGVGLQQQKDHPYHSAGELAIKLLEKRRLQMYAFFLSLREWGNSSDTGDDAGKDERIAFRMQHDGEIDVRASYCLLAPCHLLGLLDNASVNPLLSPAIPRYIASCQTFEGGFGAEPFNEAHGGYSFCALAALRILNSVSTIDVEALQSWQARRQMGFEGGFCGRTNKLVDGCYSFWLGGAVAVLDGWFRENDVGSEDNDEDDGEPTFDQMMLQRYILLCAQDVNGGLRDKPSKPRDFYHSCYNLSGLSVSQHALLSAWPSVDDEEGDGKLNRLFGDRMNNIVGKTDPVINIRVERVKLVLSWFASASTSR